MGWLSNVPIPWCPCPSRPPKPGIKMSPSQISANLFACCCSTKMSMEHILGHNCLAVKWCIEQSYLGNHLSPGDKFLIHICIFVQTQDSSFSQVLCWFVQICVCHYFIKIQAILLGKFMATRLTSLHRLTICLLQVFFRIPKWVNAGRTQYVVVQRPVHHCGDDLVICYLRVSVSNFSHMVGDG